MSTKIIDLEYPWKYNDGRNWPYNGMVNDLWRGIQADQNYLVALGLFAYSEMLGRELRGTVGNRNIGKGFEAYKEFTENFVGYAFEESLLKDIFDRYRNGLAHEYFIKSQNGMSAIIYNDDGNRSCGIVLSKGTAELYIHTYFKHFVAGLEKMLNKY